MRNIDFGILGLVLVSSLGLVRAQQPDCSTFKELHADFTQAYDDMRQVEARALATQLFELSQACQDIPETDRFWEAMHLQVVGDSTSEVVVAEALAYNSSNGDSLAYMRVLNLKAAQASFRGELEVASADFRQSFEFYGRQGNYPAATRAALNLANCQNQLNHYGQGLEAVLNGLRLLGASTEPMPDKLTMQGQLHLVGAFSYLQMDHFEDAEAFNLLAIEEFKAGGGSRFMANALSLLGGLYLEMGRPDSAEKYLVQSLEVMDTSNFYGLQEYGRIAFSLGHLAYDRKDYASALAYAQTSSANDFRIGNQENFYQSQTLLGRVFAEINPVRGEEILLNCKAFYKDSRRFDYMLQIAMGLGTIYARRGEVEKSIDNWKWALACRDSTYEREMTEAMENARIKYQTEQKEAQIALQADALEQAEQLAAAQNNLLWTVGVGLGVALLLGGLALAGFWQKKRANGQLALQKAEITKQNEEKATLLKEIHHRVKNNLQIVSNLLELQTRNIDDAQARALAQEGQSRVHSMALIHQKLYQNEDLNIQFEDYVGKLVGEIKKMYGGMEVETSIDGKGHRFDIDTAIPLGLIVNELVTNAFKYAFQDSSHKKLHISLEKQADDFHQLTISDTGPGLPPDLDIAKTRSLGLRLVRRLAKQLHGKVHYSRQDGSTFTLLFKDTPHRLQVD